MRNVIINADDFGASGGVNDGILRAHLEGVVTSTSLMVHGAAAADAVARAARIAPGLALGLHLDLDGEDHEPRVDFADAGAVRAELEVQLERFERLVGRPPTHLDSHHHVHEREEIAPAARALADRVGRPLRGDGRVHYVGGFYGQWEWQVTDVEHVSVAALCAILSEELVGDWTEIGCHPGLVTAGFRSVYLYEREAELATLTDPLVRRHLDGLGVRLASFADVT